MCFALQMSEWELVLNKKNLVLFLASQLGSWRLARLLVENTSKDFQLDFDIVYDYNLMAEWIDRLAPENWSQKYFEELRDVCLKLIVLEMPSKYDYLYYCTNVLPQIVDNRYQK